MNQMAPGIWKLTFGTPEQVTPVNARTEHPLEQALRSLPVCEEIPFSPSDIQFRSMARGTVIQVPMAPAEQIFGFGLSLKVLNPTGTRKVMRVTDSPGNDLGDSHAPVPFYVSNKGYGVYVDTARMVSFAAGYVTPKEKETGKPSRSMQIDVPTAQGVDVYMFAGPSMREVVQRYNLFSGGGVLPPLWGLGILYRGYGKYNAQEVLGLAKEFREHHMPCDVFGLEPGWQSQTYSCSYVWSQERWPDPDGFIQSMTDMGFQLNLWEHAFVHPSSPLHEEMKEHSGDDLVWGGLVPDFLTSQAREIFSEYHEKNFVLKGVSGFKLDECDNQPLSATPWSFPDWSVFPSGADGEQMHALLGPLYQRVLAELFEKKNRRTFGQVRASHALASPLPFVLYSDHYDHRDFVRGVVTCGFGGILWQPEVRDCGSIEELYRRIQTAMFSPQAVINAWFLAMPPWRQIHTDKNVKGEVLPNAQEVEEACRKLFELRMSFIPYLYSAYARYRQEGLPPFRALVMDSPDDPNTFKLDDEYLMGDTVLVAPIFAGQSGRSVYLPQGEWFCFWTGNRYEGGKTHEIQMGVEQIPLFVRSGSLLPLARPVEHITPDTCFDLTVRVYGEAPKDFILYEDDGMTLDYEKGRQNPVVLSWTPDRQGHVARTGPYPNIRYQVKSWEAIGSP